MADNIYCGNGRLFSGKFGVVPKISMSKKDIDTILLYMKTNNLEWVNLEMLEKKNKEDKKPTHYVKIDTWKPEQNEPVNTQAKSIIKKEDIDYASSGLAEDDPPF